MRQSPPPGERMVKHRGDCLTIELVVAEGVTGCAYVRTNLEKADIRRGELIDWAEEGLPILSRDWHDVPMVSRGEGRYTAVLPLLEPGIFELKAFFLPAAGTAPLWVPGANISVKVEPAFTVCSSTIYSAFPRQFGRWRSGNPLRPELDDAVGLLDSEGYSVIPPSGTFRDLIEELDLVIGTMGFRIIQLLPIHPVPTTYARMGRYGSPFAALDFFDVDPALAEFDRRSTPLEQFRELVDAIHARNAKVLIDLPANHTGWASHLQVHHPAWFTRSADGAFVSPGAWGVVWEDLCKLDYEQRELWRYMADVFLHWCRQGVDGFRCDAGYMVPLHVWQYITAKVRRDFPDTLFLLEGLGGPASVTEKLMQAGNLDWAYSELFQQFGADSIASYTASCTRFSAEVGTMVHFAETHDNNRLAATSRRHACLRTAMSALFADAGAYGITNGVEWFAEEKLDVHGASNLNWGGTPNQVEWIRRLRVILDTVPAFHAGAQLRFLPSGLDDVLVLHRCSPDGDGSVLVVVNLNESAPRRAQWVPAEFPCSESGVLYDVLSRSEVSCGQAEADRLSVDLAPGQVLCLCTDEALKESIRDSGGGLTADPERVTRQRFRGAVLSLARHLDGPAGLGDMDLDELSSALREDPFTFAERFADAGGYTPVVDWHLSRDCHRVVMLPPGHVLLVRASERFRAELCRGDRRLSVAESLEDARGGGFAFLFSPPLGDGDVDLSLCLTVFSGNRSGHLIAPLLGLSSARSRSVSLVAAGVGLRDPELCGLCTTALGGMSFVRGGWSTLHSKYDAILSANLDSAVPVDRRVLLTRVRGWLVCRGYSQRLDVSCQTRFQSSYDNRLYWDFRVPAGMGRSVSFRIIHVLDREANRVTLDFHRLTAAGGGQTALADDIPVTLIVRPDLEDRNAHETTQAYSGPEDRFPRAISAAADAFTFAPLGDHSLAVRFPGARFVHEPEWTYRVRLPFEEQRGLGSATDLFSPGYFQLSVGGGEVVSLTAAACTELESVSRVADAKAVPPGTYEFGEALTSALAPFVVRRDSHRTVIAGYPWFLDWGRDTLIALRGLIAAGQLDSCRDILVEFASFEREGTLPNMIRGMDDSNRDTSDAPLWLFTAVQDFMHASRGRDILETPCGDRSLLEVLVSIGTHYIEGTPNGIRVDPGSGLVFSPAHFTWMDTNHPAATPREGYPIEIQALWIAALTFLRTHTGDARWSDLAERVRESVVQCFTLEGLPFLSDCLHASRGTPASGARADDANRPNQLLAVTLGAVPAASVGRRVVRACSGLLTPGGIRSLDNRRVRVELPVRHRGELLNDPSAPYWGTYGGDEDTRRKPAYHNGTAWTWPFPSYCEALAMVYGPGAASAALAVLHSASAMLQQGCLGHIAEILDGDAPHALRGCGAQAWGASELYRVNRLLTEMLEQIGSEPAQI